MRGVAFLFLLLAVISAIIGMAWGIHMGMSQDFTLSPAHAHLNLLGWVSMSIYAFYYQLVAEAGRSLLARLHLVLAAAGVAVMVPGIAIAISTPTHVETFAILGSLLTFASMVVFLVIVARFRPRAAC